MNGVTINPLTLATNYVNTFSIFEWSPFTLATESIPPPLTCKCTYTIEYTVRYRQMYEQKYRASINQDVTKEIAPPLTSYLRYDMHRSYSYTYRKHQGNTVCASQIFRNAVRVHKTT